MQTVRQHSSAAPSAEETRNRRAIAESFQAWQTGDGGPFDLLAEDVRWTITAVKREGRWGYVDSQGTVIVQPLYDGAFAFSQGRAAVHRGGLWGYIDPKGAEVVPLQFRDARGFKSNGVA